MILVVIVALYFGREVLITITLAMLRSFIVSPLVELLRRAWLGRILSVMLAVVLALGVILALGTQVAQLAQNFPQYQTTIEEKIIHLRDATVRRLSEAVSGLGHQLGGPGANRSTPPPARASAGSPTQEQKPVPVMVTQPHLSVLQIGKG